MTAPFSTMGRPPPSRLKPAEVKGAIRAGSVVRAARSVVAARNETAVRALIGTSVTDAGLLPSMRLEAFSSPDTSTTRTYIGGISAWLPTYATPAATILLA